MLSKIPLIGSANHSVDFVRPEEFLGRMKDLGNVRKPSYKKQTRILDAWNGIAQPRA